MKHLRPLFLALSLPLCAQAEGEGDSFLLTMENDVFTGTDNQYTSGLRAEYTGPEGKIPHVALPVRAALSDLTGEDARWRMVYGVVNNIFTPPDISVANPARDQRPYAGWTYAFAGMMAEGPSSLDVFRADIGVTGPPSLAEHAQKGLHKVIGSPDPKGWDTQIGTAPTFALSWAHVERHGAETSIFGLPLRLEALPHAQIVAGTVDTYAAIGGTLRIGGNFAADFGPAVFRRGMSGAGVAAPAEGFGWSVFAGVEGRAYAHSGLIEGPLTGDDRAADAKTLVGDVFIGASLSYGDASLVYSYVTRSKEYDRQPNSTQLGHHQFGSLALRVVF
ncbi:MAG: lipid A deacylase LpxR family protein [Paracoccaceae bacterium]